MDEQQKKLKRLVARRHPEYADMLPHWTFLRSCYEGGRDWFKDNIFKYVKEGETEYTDRVLRCYRFNHTREVVDLVNKYLFKIEIARNEEDAPDFVKRFWHAATLGNLTIEDFVNEISRWASVYGRVWIVVDSSKTVDDGVESIADQKVAGDRAYAYMVTPENVCDMSYDDHGHMNWILIHEQVRDDENPVESSGNIIDRFRLWERDQWTLLTIEQEQNATDADLGVFPTTSAWEVARKVAEIARTGKTGDVGGVDPGHATGNSKFNVKVEGPFPHEFGMVPVFAADNVITHDPYCAPSLIDDVAYLDRAVANYLSNLDAIIQDQTFSQLIMPAQGLVPGEDAYDKLVEMSTKRVFTYDGEGGGKPEYISPDVKQAELILSVISKIINEIYHTVGLAGERTKEDNSQGIDNSSGVAKAYDFERVNSLLAAKANSLEVVENRLVEFVYRWNGEKYDQTKRLIAYPKNFDVRGLYDEFEIAARLSLIEAPDMVRQKQMEGVIDKLFPKLAEDIKTKMIAALKDWPPKPEIDPLTGQPVGGAKQEGSLTKAGKNSLANKLVKDGV